QYNNEFCVKINDCCVQDSGSYKAAIVDQSSEPVCSLLTTNACQLKVNQIDVQFVTPLEKCVKAKKDDTVKLYCETVQENLVPKWYHNQVFIQNSAKSNKQIFSTPTQHLLILNDVTEQDSGQYKLKFGNSGQEYYTQVILDNGPFGAPENNNNKNKTQITLPLKDCQIREGQNVHLEIGLNRILTDQDVIEVKRNSEFLLLSTGGGNLTNYDQNFMKDFELDSDGTKFSLSIKNCDKSFDGEYEFNLIEMDAGQANALRTKCTVSVLSYSPKCEIVKPLPRMVRIDEGEVIRLECELDKKAERSVWFHNSLKIEPVVNQWSKIDLLVENQGKTHKLHVSNASVKCEGTYQFHADDKISLCEVKIRPAEAKFVQKPPQSIDFDIREEELEENDTLSIDCVLSKNSAPVKWFKQDQELETNEKYEIISEGPIRCLKIFNLDPTDSADYFCSIGADVCKTKVNVTEAKIDKKNNYVPTYEKISAHEGKSIILEVEVGEHDLDRTKWFKDGTFLTINKRVTIEVCDNKQVLKIDKIMKDDEGIYELYLIENQEKILISCVELSVKEKTIAIVRKLSAKKVEQSLLKLECEVSAPLTGNIKYYWLKNGKEIDLDKKNVKTRIMNERVCQMFIDKFDHDDSGLYEFVVFDLQEPEMKEVSSFRLEIKQNPFKTGMKIVNSNMTETKSLKIEFETINNEIEIDDFKWKKDGKELDDDEREKYKFRKTGKNTFCLEIQDIKKKDNGLYECNLGEFSNKLNLSGIE
ncbi:hypothetical protein BpHYR1_008185, partial [Brachionus plicatilis]